MSTRAIVIVGALNACAALRMNDMSQGMGSMPQGLRAVREVTAMGAWVGRVSEDAPLELEGLHARWLAVEPVLRAALAEPEGASASTVVQVYRDAVALLVKSRTILGKFQLQLNLVYPLLNAIVPQRHTTRSWARREA